MKRVIFTSALVISASIASFAQAPNAATRTQNVQAIHGAAPIAAQNTQVAAPVQVQQSPEALAEKQAKAYQKQLKLTKEQYKDVYATELNSAQHEQALK